MQPAPRTYPPPPAQTLILGVLAVQLVQFVLLGAACGDDTPGDLPDADPETPVTVTELTVSENPRNPLSYYVSWRTSAALPTHLVVDCGPDYRQSFQDVPPQPQTRVQHEVFVMGLFPGLSCTVTVHSDWPLLEGQTTATIDAVASLPPPAPALTVEVLDASRMEPGWTLWSAADADNSGDAAVVAIDAQARYRWYYAPGMNYQAPEPEVMPIDGGVLLGSLRADSQIVSWEGEVQWRVNHRSHHDMVLSPWNDRHMLFLSNGVDPCPSTGSEEHSAVEMDMDTHEILWEWWICDYWTPRLAYDGWSHLNALEPVPDERTMLLSSRNQDAIFKVDRDTSELLWALGRDGDFAMDPADHFLRQHSPEAQPDGTILLFDNGLRAQEAANEGLAAREYSRVLQLALTFDASGQPDRADVVWEYTDPTVFATSRSEADRLPNGNTLLHYCYVWPDRNTVLREVTSELEIVWNVSTTPNIASYRSERFPPYYGNVLTGD